MTVMLIVRKREKLEERESVFKWCLRLETQRDSPCLPQPSPHTPARTHAHTHTCSGPTGLLGLPAAQVSSWDTVSSKCKFGARTRACTLSHTQTHARVPPPVTASPSKCGTNPQPTSGWSPWSWVGPGGACPPQGTAGDGGQESSWDPGGGVTVCGLSRGGGGRIWPCKRC